MPHVENLFDSDIFVGVIVVILTIIFLFFYTIIKPSNKLSSVFTPYPKFAPKEVPDQPSTGSGVGTSKIISCKHPTT